MEYTGERVIPGKTPYHTLQEHVNRYIFAANFIKDLAVLDVACGTGYGSDILKKSGAHTVIGVDISKESIAYSKAEYNEPYFIQADSNHLPLKDKYLDAIISFETIEHIKNHDIFLAECKRVLKNGGIFIVSTPNKRITSNKREKPLNPYHYKEFYPNEFEKLLSNYFVNVKLYGQYDINLLKHELYLNKYLNKKVFLNPFFDRIKKLFIKNNGYNVNIVEDKQIMAHPDKRFRVVDYHKNKFTSPLYIIAYSEKSM